MSIHSASIHTVLVCLPDAPEPRHTAQAATTQLALRGITADGVMPHFTPRTTGGLRGMLHTRQLIDMWQGTTAGGPIRLLDLTAMRLRAQAQAATQWLIWHHTVAGTKPAQPFWAFAQRHQDSARCQPSGSTTRR